MEINEFIQSLQSLSLDVTDEKLYQLDQFYQLLIEWNEKMNLTGITDKKEVYLKHFYDSLTLTRKINLNEQENLCDIGTGAGFPGLVLKIFYPNLKVTLIESLQKRVQFLNKVIETLDLKKIEVFNERAEDYAREHREKFDVVTSRAVADIYVLLEYSIPLVKVGKYFIPMKGKNIDFSYTRAEKELSCKLKEIDEFFLPKENSIRNILIFQKTGKTNKKYPRKYSDIKKRPLR